MSKWIYKIVTANGNEKTTYEYDRDGVADFHNDGNELVITMKSGAMFGHNRRYVTSWRLIEVP